MILTIRLFAVARERAGRGTIAAELPEGSTVGYLRRVLAESEPALATLLPSVMIAVDSEYADDARVIRSDSEVALIPPVSGG